MAIDAGHGGQDPGAIGRAGTYEKDVVLDISKRLAERINQEPGMRAVLTRDGDYFLKHRERIRRARAAGAQLFVSVHADAVRDPSVSGSSVYVLSEKGASDEQSRWLADRENAADLAGGISLDVSSMRDQAKSQRERLDLLIAGNNDHSQMLTQLEQSFDEQIANGTTEINFGGPIPSGDEIAAEFEKYLRER